MKYWQLASGDQTRDYSKVFLEFGVACLGSGNPGPISESTIPDYKQQGEWDKIKPIIDVQPGDRIVLRNGQRIIKAVGEVVPFRDSIYNFSNCFNDIDGWDLQHFVKVRWKNIEFSYDRNEMTRTTIESLYNPRIIADIDLVWEQNEFLDDKYTITDPSSKDDLGYKKIEQFLIDSGMRVQDAENTSQTIKRVEKLANWYLEQSMSATEHEIRTFLVVPFLDALGWSPQKMAIEQCFQRKKIDLLLYQDSNRTNPKILIETKTMGNGSALAICQASNYIRDLEELSSVERFIVTDGLRYWFYEKEETGFNPKAYMNFNNKRIKYSAYPDVGGMLDFFKRLSPIL